MAGSSFGSIFRITTWGESHGKALGVVIDGCPAGLALEEAHIRNIWIAASPAPVRSRLPGKRPTP